MPFSARPATVRPSWLLTDLATKTALGALLIFSVTHTDWDRFADKAMTARAVAYPLLVALVPVAWSIARRRRPGLRYPASTAALLTTPFLVDVAGNALDLYDRIDVFDDICHLGNWALLAAAVGTALPRTLPPWVVAGLCTGFGAATAIGWEIAEYGAFVTDTPERFTLYRDTVGDLALGLSGSLLAGVACAVALSRAARRPVVPRSSAPRVPAGTAGTRAA